MGRPTKFGPDVVQRARELRGVGFTYTDIRDALRREFGEAPKEIWVYNKTKDVEAAKAVARTEAVKRVREIEAEVETIVRGDGVSDLDRLRGLATDLDAQRRAVAGNPTAVSSLSRVLVQVLALIDKQTPPPPPPKEDAPDWVVAAAKCRAKMHELLDRILEAKNEPKPAENVPSQGR